MQGKQDHKGNNAPQNIWENKAILLLFLTGAVYFFLKYLWPLIAPVLIAGIFLTLWYPSFDDIQKKTHIKKQYMAAGILFLVCALLIVIIWFGGYALIQKLPELIKNADTLVYELKDNLLEMIHKLGEKWEVDVEEIGRYLEEQFVYFFTHIEEQILPQMIENTWNYISIMGKVVGMIAITMIAIILLAKDYDVILACVGERKSTRIGLAIFLKVIRHIATFIKAQLFIMLIISLICVLGLYLVGISNGVFFGILAGFLDALPFIGTGIVLFPLAIFSLLKGNFFSAIVCLALYGSSAFIREFLEPKLIGKRVGIYPVLVLASVYAGVKLFGISGIFKGPFGLILLVQTYSTLCAYIDNKSYHDL